MTTGPHSPQPDLTAMAADPSVVPIANRAARLFIVLAAFLVSNAIIAEFVGVKIFALEPTFGLVPLNWNLFGQSGSLSFTSGVLLWPFVFLMTDIINEYFGRRGVRFISWLTVALIVYGSRWSQRSSGCR
jgi:queuosine precursor transporter